MANHTYLDGPLSAAGVSAPTSAQSSAGTHGVFTLTGSTVNSPIKVPLSLPGAYIDIQAIDCDFKFCFATGSSAPTLSYSARATVASDGTLTSNPASGWSVMSGTTLSVMCPKLPSGGTLWASYIQKNELNTTGSLELRLSDQQRHDLKTS